MAFLQMVQAAAANPGSMQQQRPLAPNEVAVTQKEYVVIQRLESLGFDQQTVIRAWLQCGKSELQAANYLFDNAVVVSEAQPAAGQASITTAAVAEASEVPDQSEQLLPSVVEEALPVAEEVNQPEAQVENEQDQQDQQQQPDAEIQEAVNQQQQRAAVDNRNAEEEAAESGYNSIDDE